MHKAISLLLLTLFCFQPHAHSQEVANQWSLGPELQVYPTGFIPGIRVQKSVGSKSFLSLRIGANIFDHRDMGEQEEEKGNGGGFTVGFHSYPFVMAQKLQIGIKNDIWWNRNKWKNPPGSGRPPSGTTNITVLQPTAELGYALGSSQQSFRIIPTISFGFEINVQTKGEPVGEGLILLAGIQALYYL